MTLQNALSSVSAKRQRSADGRLSIKEGRNASDGSSPGKSLNPRFRMPAYLNKSVEEQKKAFYCLQTLDQQRSGAAARDDRSPWRRDASNIASSRNRYPNVAPFAENTISLQDPIDGSTYINASPIVLGGLRSNAVTEPTRYIAAQGPKDTTALHFWHMVHQNCDGGIAVIIQLTEFVERFVDKCAEYLPTDLTKPHMILKHDASLKATAPAEATNGSAVTSEASTQDSIVLLSMEMDTTIGCEVRKLRLTINSQSKTIHHYLYKRWPDMGEPHKNDSKLLVELTRRTYTEAAGCPRVVHCSAGIGRTGTWIALDHLVREDDAGRLTTETTWSNTQVPAVEVFTPTQETSIPPLDGPLQPIERQQQEEEQLLQESKAGIAENDQIYAVVDALKRQRAGMVYTQDQYLWLYTILRQILEDKHAMKQEGPVLTDVMNEETNNVEERQAKVARIQEEKNDDDESDAETILDDNDTNDNDNDNKNGADVTETGDRDVTNELQDIPSDAISTDDNDPYAVLDSSRIAYGSHHTEQNA